MDSQRIKPILSAIFIDYDNIYLSLKRKSVVAARQFAKAPRLWLKEIERGTLIASHSDLDNGRSERRIVLNRSYGNPVPRRTGRDGSADMNSFPFVRQHFLRAGCEIVDCPPLTAQLKNSSDIRMVMDIRDLIHHETHFDEFIILSGDSDFTPVLHRLRAHARRTVVYVNDHTAMPYTAIADGEIREADLIHLLEHDETDERDDVWAGDHAHDHEHERPRDEGHRGDGSANHRPLGQDRAGLQDAILAEVVSVIRTSDKPVPIEFLADRAQRKLGKENTAGTNWAGFGNFRAFLTACLPLEFRLTNERPFLAYDAGRHEPPAGEGTPRTAERQHQLQPDRPQPPTQPAPVAPPGLNLQQAIGRIQEACQAPPLSPQEYTAVFEAIAREINENGLNGNQTLNNIGARAAASRVNIHPTDIRFVLDVVSEADPWFEQGASVNLFAGRFRNFVVTRCRTQGMELSPEELDLIDAWFAGTLGNPPPVMPQASHASAPAMGDTPTDTGGLPPLYGTDGGAGPYAPSPQAGGAPHPQRDDEQPHAAPPINPATLGDLADVDVGQLPRIVRSRMRT